MERRPIVGVMGSGVEPHRELALPLGRRIATRGCHLLTGAGGGVMAAVAEAFVAVPERAGVAIGVVPGWVDDAGRYHAPAGYPNAAIELAIHTHLPLSGEEGEDPRSRNHVNVLTADALVILPGGAGTRSEARLAERYGKPTILFGPSAAFATFPTSLPRATHLDVIDAFLDRLAPGSRS